jgi:hypothetical protein
MLERELGLPPRISSQANIPTQIERLDDEFRVIAHTANATTACTQQPGWLALAD